MKIEVEKMNSNTKQMVAIITGGARGLGAAVAQRLVADGAKVIITDVLDDEGEALAERLGPSAIFAHLDVVQEQEWTAVVAIAKSTFGLATVLVNNAGIVIQRPLLELSEADYRKVIDINQVGVFLGMKAVASSMREAGGGSIINISSIAGIIAFPDIIGYVSSKWAVRGMSKAAAQELGRYGIRVTSLHPGVIQTPMTADMGADQQTAHQPLPHPGRPEDIADAVAFLASDQSCYITGTELVVDGGFTSL